MHEPAETPEGKAYREWLRWGIDLAWRLGKMDHLSSGEMRRVIEERLNTLDATERELRLIRALIANDAYAITFPSMAMYRRALLKSIVTIERQAA
jgi:transcriptional regulator CtsR